MIWVQPAPWSRIVAFLDKALYDDYFWFSAWWLPTSGKFTWEEVKRHLENLEHGQTGADLSKIKAPPSLDRESGASPAEGQGRQRSPDFRFCPPDF